ncbi:ribosome maturation factor RimP [Acholeplasma hippikon]|uniref:Ribosome maturation factor RimP n=1 Tax=Acholeplasma hippikon TaxID=264636 RepID=A0A449BJN1_9MOLU|nr:ribosome assembly cofactor RimP [Acholeplasma hippikon]VEU82676.1 SP14.3 [Acholeplasma hippikon]
MNLNLIKEKVLAIFSKHDLVLYDIFEERMGKEKILTILIDNEIDHTSLEAIHMEVLDEINDDIPDNYYLQLSTVGIEKELRNIDEVTKNVGGYVYIESQNFTGDATLDSVEEGILKISFFLKGRPKKLAIPYEQIKFIRLAVKF